ncbi:MAG: sigma-70 family RNA polymerase sigma factor [Phycisphaerales bacterium]
METPAPHEVTQLLAAVSEGDSHAAAQLLPLVYDELRKLAKSRMAHEPAGGAGMTLQPTALVHEAYLRLLGDTQVGWDNRGHFFAAAALAMRRILVERARSRNRIKRGGGRAKVELNEALLSTEPPSDELLTLDDALTKLEQYDKRKAEVVMLRYFAGLSIEDTAAAMGLSPATVKNEWMFARAWLHREVAKDDQGGASQE